MHPHPQAYIYNLLEIFVSTDISMVCLIMLHLGNYLVSNVQLYTAALI